MSKIFNFLKLYNYETLKPTWEAAIQVKRHAGHSKWQNIRHTKALMDHQRASLFLKYSRLIKLAIVENGNPNPDYNHKLQVLIQQAKKDNMPQMSIQNAIKTATGAGSAQLKSHMFEARGSNRCCILIEILSEHISRTKQDVGNILKRHNAKFDNNIKSIFKERGIIIAEGLNVPDPSETAMDHAIEAGAEEVEVDGNDVQFECGPIEMLKVKGKLEGLGYKIVSASIEYIPTFYVELNEKDLETHAKLHSKLEALQDIVRVVDNVA